MVVVEIGSNKFKLPNIETAVEVVKALESAEPIKETYQPYPKKSTYHPDTDPPVIRISVVNADVAPEVEVAQ